MKLQDKEELAKYLRTEADSLEKYLADGADNEDALHVAWLRDRATDLEHETKQEKAQSWEQARL